MMKPLLISVQILGFFLLMLSQKQDIKVTHDAPAVMKPGEEALVNITLDKSDVMGFAKFQITLDEGLTAELVDGGGASFTFNNQVGKFIWMALPEGRKITMKVRIKASADALGNLEISQRFSYIYNNERKNFDAEPHTIAVGEQADLNALRVKESMAKKSDNSQASLQTERTIIAAGVNQWRVEIHVDKQDLSGFAKIEENIPNGYTVIDLKSSGAIFNIDDNEVKYIWYDFPESDRVTVSYKMLPVIAMEAQKPQIKGTFSFLRDEETIVVPIEEGDGIRKDEIAAEVAETAPETPTPDQDTADSDKAETGDEVAEAITEPKPESVPKPAPSPEPAPAPEPESKPEPAAETAEATTPAPKAEKQEPKAQPRPEPKDGSTATAKAFTDGNIVDVPMPETGIFYRVQIAAGKNNLSKAVFEKLYKFEEGFHLEPGGTWIKYTTGFHQIYKSARNDRERITAKYDKFQGPFVAAYNNGERITVQEALMVTKQKWVP